MQSGVVAVEYDIGLNVGLVVGVVVGVVIIVLVTVVVVVAVFVVKKANSSPRVFTRINSLTTASAYSETDVRSVKR